jgi:hypothetical protein
LRIADLQLSTAGGAVIARMTGEIDMSNATDLRAAIAESTPNGAFGVVLDLSDWITSTAPESTCSTGSATGCETAARRYGS